MKREPDARMNVLRAPYALGERPLDKYLIGVRRGFHTVEPVASITLGDSSYGGHWSTDSGQPLASVVVGAGGAQISPRAREPAATLDCPSREGRDAVTGPVPAGTCPGKGRGAPTAAGGRRARLRRSPQARKRHQRGPSVAVRETADGVTRPS